MVDSGWKAFAAPLGQHWMQKRASIQMGFALQIRIFVAALQIMAASWRFLQSAAADRNVWKKQRAAVVDWLVAATAGEGTRRAS